MAAQTAATNTISVWGDMKLNIFTFTSVTGADTFASGLPNVVAYWAQANNAGGTTTTATGVNVLNASGTFTFQVGFATTPVILFVLSKG